MWRVVGRLVPGKAVRAHVTVVHTTADTGPRRGFGRAAETSGAIGGRAVRDPLKRVHSVHGKTAHLSRNCFGDRLRWRSGRELAGCDRRVVLGAGDARRQNRSPKQAAPRWPHRTSITIS